MIVIVGPTAAGKTELALALARSVGGEVISADSRQVYRELSAGTAKPLQDAQGRVEGVPCHLLGCAGIGETFDAGRFAAAAQTAAADIRQRGRVPIVAGGTGLYVRALLDGLVDLPARDEALRRRLEDEARAAGRAALHERLARVDPEAAARIPPNNLQRVVRALEVFELAGEPISSLWRRARRTPGLRPSAVLGIEWPAEALRRRIGERAARMWPAMLEEVRGLLLRFTGLEPGFQSLGYREAVACVRGGLDREEGLRLLVHATCAYARRQRTWFRHQLDAAPVAGGRTQDMLTEALRCLERAAAQGAKAA